MSTSLFPYNTSLTTVDTVSSVVSCIMKYDRYICQLQLCSRNCVIPVVCVRTLGSVGSRTQLSMRCNFSDYVLRNNYMFRPMMAIFRLSWEYSRATVSYIARIM